MSKKCSKCGIVKETCEFNRHKCMSDGIRSTCKECDRVARRIYNEANKDKNRARQARWNANNKEHIKEYCRDYYQKHREQIIAYHTERRAEFPEKYREISRTYEARNRERRREKNRRWRRANRDYIKSHNRQWREDNPEKAREASRRWNRANPDKGVTYQHRRRAHLLRATGSHTPAEWLEVIWKQGFACAMCGEIKPLARDHIIPISRGGADYISNIQGLCRSCNSRKGAKLPNELL